MFKKLVSTLLCLIMVLSVIGVSAVMQQETRDGKTIYIENFDLDTPSTAQTPPIYNSELLPKSTVEGNVSRGRVTAQAGPDNSNAFVINGHNSEKQFQTFGLDFANKSYQLSYDIKFTAIGTLSSWTLVLGANGKSTTAKSYNATFFSIAADGTVTVRNGSANSSTGRKLSNDVWYHVNVIEIGDTKYGWLYDDNGNSFYATTSGISTTTYDTLQVVTARSSAWKGITFDNVELAEYDAKTVAPVIKTPPAISDTIPADTKTLSVSLSQWIDISNSKVSLINDGDCTIAMDKSKPYTYTITLPDMEGGQNYTLDLSGLKNSGGAAVGSSAVYSFKTAAAYISPAVVSSAPEAGATNVSIGTKTMSITFNKAMTAPQTAILTGGTTDITATVTPSNDNQTFTLNWTDALEDLTTYTVSLANFKDDQETAAETASLSFTTENTGIVKLIDNLDEAVSSNHRGYNTSQSEAYALTADDSQAGSDYVTLVDTGKTGKALQLKTGTKNACIKTLRTTTAHTPAYDEESGQYEQFVLTYSFNLQQVAKYDGTSYNNTSEVYAGAMIRFAADDSTSPNYSATIAAITSDAQGNPYIGVHGAGAAQKVALDAQKWYNVVWSIDGVHQTFSLIDSTTGKRVFSTEKDATGVYTAGEAINMLVMSAQGFSDAGKRYNQNQIIWVDDFTLWKIKPWMSNHALKITNVTGENGTYAMTFNQPVIATKSMLTVEADANGENVPVNFGMSSLYPDFCQQTITVNDLAASSTFTLDYSGIRALSGVGINDSAAYVKTFSTPAGGETLVSLGDAIDDSVAGQLTFDVYNGAADSVQVYVAYYFEGELKAVKVPAESISVAAGSYASVTVPTIDELYDSIKVLAWNNGLQPLMKVYSQVIEIPAQ